MLDETGYQDGFSGTIFRDCDFKGANFKFDVYDEENDEEFSINWSELDRNLEFYQRPYFINCTMPDGSKWNDPEPQE